MSDAPIKSMGWATRANYTSGPDAGLPTKVTPDTALQNYGIQAETPPPAAQLNYVLNALDQMLSVTATQELHSWNVVNAYEYAEHCVDVPAGGVLVLANHGSAETLAWLPSPQTYGAVTGTVTTVLRTRQASGPTFASRYKWTQAVGATVNGWFTCIAISQDNGAALTVEGRIFGTLMPYWPDTSVASGVDGDWAGGDRKMTFPANLDSPVHAAWDTYHSKLMLATSYYVGSIAIPNDALGITVALGTHLRANPQATSYAAWVPSGSINNVVVACDDKGVTQVYGADGQGCHSTDGASYAASTSLTAALTSFGTGTYLNHFYSAAAGVWVLTVRWSDSVTRVYTAPSVAGTAPHNTWTLFKSLAWNRYGTTATAPNGVGFRHFVAIAADRTVTRDAGICMLDLTDGTTRMITVAETDLAGSAHARHAAATATRLMYTDVNAPAIYVSAAAALPPRQVAHV